MLIFAFLFVLFPLCLPSQVVQLLLMLCSLSTEKYQLGQDGSQVSRLMEEEDRRRVHASHVPHPSGQFWISKACDKSKMTNTRPHESHTAGRLSVAVKHRHAELQRESLEVPWDC